MSIELRHKNLFFFNKNGEYCNFSYEGIIPLTQKPIDWEYNKKSYYKEDPENEGEYIPCDGTEPWGEDENGYEVFYFTKSDKWVGEIYLDEVSTDLFSIEQLLILEKDNEENYRLPWKKTFTVGEETKTVSNFVVSFQEDLPDIFLFGYDENYVNYTQTALSQEPDGPDLVRGDFLSIGLSEENEIQKEAGVINIALCSSEENTFKRTLYIYEAADDFEPVDDDIKNNIVALITIYGKTVGEDERFKTICENFGYNIIDTDSIAFEKTNVKEILSDWAIVNEKRKEIILEGHNIYPYIGAYKGVINAIKYFGYNELQLREFWRNVDPNSPYYGKYVQTDCVNFLSVDNVRFNQPTVTLPSKQYRKTSLFALVYKINDITEGAYDEDGLPLTHENQTYTQEEILIKLFALKRKLEKDFLPLNARIKDIIGEADFFALNELTNSVGVNMKTDIQAGISPTFTVINGEKYNELDDTVYANLVDLRTFLAEYYNSVENTVGSAPMTYFDASNVLSGLVSWWNLFTSPREKYSLVIDNELVCLESIMTQGASDNNFSVKKLSEVYLAYFKDYSPNLKHTGYWEEERQPEYLGDVDALPDDWHFITNFTINDNGKYVPYDPAKNIEQFNKPENLPVGALVILRNTTFDNFIFDNREIYDSIDSLNITYNELAKGNKYDVLTFGLENYAEYHCDEDGKLIEGEEGEELALKFDGKEIAKYTTTKFDTVNTIMRTIYTQCVESKKGEFSDILINVEFYFDEEQNELNVQGSDGYKLKWTITHPKMESEFEGSVESDMRYSVAVSNRKAMGHSMFSWDNIHKFDTTTIEWTIKKDATEFSPSYYFNIKGDIDEYNELPVVLPYVGKYTIEMRLYNMYNNISSLVKRDYLEVVGREVEFSGWYTTQEESNGFEQEIYEEEGSGEGEDPTTRVLNYWNSKAVTPRNNEYTWENCKDYKIGEYGSPFENAIKPSSLWEEATPALYEGLDNANIIENNTIDIDDKNMHTSNFQSNGQYSNKGAYVWKNCKCTWNEAFHKSWDTTEETGDIPFYIDIDTSVMNTEGNMTSSGIQDTEIGETEVRLGWSSPKLLFKLQHDFIVRNELDDSAKDCVFEADFDNLTNTVTLPDFYNALKEHFRQYVDIDRFLNVNYIYKENEYSDESELIESDKKLYLESSETESDAKYYKVNGSSIEYSSDVLEDAVEINYLKQIANIDFYISGEHFTGNLDTIKRDNLNVPIVNFNKLVSISRPKYRETQIIHTPTGSIEQEIGTRDVKNSEMEDVPDNFITGNSVDTTNYKEGLVPWKYYKRLVGMTIDESSEPTKWYYTYVNAGKIDVVDEDGSTSTKYINRLTPTREKIDGIEYTEITDESIALKHENYRNSYCYLQYAKIPQYQYYKAEPCENYKLMPYIRYAHTPDGNPERMQIIGKYNSQICDVFDIDLAFTVSINGEEQEELRSFGFEGTGITQHNTEIHNPTWNNVNFINSWKKLPKLTRICFTYDKCKILGKRNPTWTFKNLTTGSEKTIKSKYGMYLFTEAGDYTITLELYDSNKNKYNTTKNYLTII